MYVDSTNNDQTDRNHARPKPTASAAPPPIPTPCSTTTTTTLEDLHGGSSSSSNSSFPSHSSSSINSLSSKERLVSNRPQQAVVAVQPTLPGPNATDDVLRTKKDAVKMWGEGKFWWISATEVPKDTKSYHYFSTDRQFFYEPFYADFGPLNLGQIFRYCELITRKLQDSVLASKTLVHVCGRDPKFRVNAALLSCAYQVIVIGDKPSEVVKSFDKLVPALWPYRDATYGSCNYRLTLADCLEGLYYATSLGWFALDTFDIEEYERLENVASGDINWIIPSKFLAFSGPTSEDDKGGGLYTLNVDEYVQCLKKLRVETVIRLNRKQYDRRKFTQHGIQHHDLYFVDGSCPSREIVSKFIKICESESGVVGVHCKAGLGRTGTLIGCYAIKNYRFPARLWIGWNRLCRPGSILGPQQHFLLEIESELMDLPRHNPSLHHNNSSADGRCTKTRRNGGGRSAAAPEEETDGAAINASSFGGGGGGGDGGWSSSSTADIGVADDTNRSTAAAAVTKDETTAGSPRHHVGSPRSKHKFRGFQTMTEEERKVAIHGDTGQGERLVIARHTAAMAEQSRGGLTEGGGSSGGLKGKPGGSGGGGGNSGATHNTSKKKAAETAPSEDDQDTPSAADTALCWRTNRYPSALSNAPAVMARRNNSNSRRSSLGHRSASGGGGAVSDCTAAAAATDPPTKSTTGVLNRALRRLVSGTSGKKKI